MAAVLHRTTKQYLPSANTPDYPTQDWIHNPDLSGVIGFDSRYWIITGDVVTLMSQAQRDALNASLLAAARDALVNAILTAIDNGANIGAVKTNILAITDYPQRTAAQLRTSIRNKLGV
jgi:hypothetical protein